jgi:hypothetical protein
MARFISKAASRSAVSPISRAILCTRIGGVLLLALQVEQHRLGLIRLTVLGGGLGRSLLHEGGERAGDLLALALRAEVLPILLQLAEMTMVLSQRGLDDPAGFRSWMLSAQPLAR